jgi:hypothetical protein
MGAFCVPKIEESTMELPPDIAAAIDAILHYNMADERHDFHGESDHIFRALVAVAKWRGWSDLADPDDPKFCR